MAEACSREQMGRAGSSVHPVCILRARGETLLNPGPPAELGREAHCARRVPGAWNWGALSGWPPPLANPSNPCPLQSHALPVTSNNRSLHQEQEQCLWPAGPALL